jgi:hypothetical protein
MMSNKKTQKICRRNFEEESLWVVLPGGVALDLRNPQRLVQMDFASRGADSLYYPLFPEEKNQTLKKETYLIAHEKLMSDMRTQMKRKNKRGIEQTGKKLHRLRTRYRARFAA